MAEGIVASKNLEASSPTSPSTFDTVDHEKSKGYDCEAAKDEVKLGKRSCGLFTYPQPMSCSLASRNVASTTGYGTVTNCSRS